MNNIVQYSDPGSNSSTVECCRKCGSNPFYDLTKSDREITCKRFRPTPRDRYRNNPTTDVRHSTRRRNQLETIFVMWPRRHVLLVSLVIVSVALAIPAPASGAARHLRTDYRSASLSRARSRLRLDVASGGLRRRGSGGKPSCEPIAVPMCREIGYNFTDVSLSPEDVYGQNHALQVTMEFTNLINTGCAEEMKLLLCSIYVPICMPGYPTFLPPCRFICERAKRGCFPLMQQYQYDWPAQFDCDRFPEYTGENPLCLHFNQTARDDFQHRRTSHPTTARPRNDVIEKKPVDEPAPMNASRTPTAPRHSRGRGDSSLNDCRCACRAPMVAILDRNDPLHDQVVTGGVRNCAMPCRSPYFSGSKRRFAEVWVTMWSIVCFVITLVTVSTFLIDTDRFRYPERPIVFLSTCYMFVSVGFLIRVVAGHDAVACGGHSDHVVYNTTGPFFCTVVFLLTYFFGMAGAIWWVVLSLTWFLAAGLKWGSDSIANLSQYYHAAAWIIPTLKSITALAVSSVDGDPLSGVCYVGNQDLGNLRGFVLVPLVIYLGMGGMFIFLGFLNLFRVRQSIKKIGDEKTLTIGKPMGRIGMFALLYTAPSLALVACHFYEHQNRARWSLSHNCRTSPHHRYHVPCHVAGGVNSRPEFTVFIFKYSMTLVIGITNGVWICSAETVRLWAQFYKRCRTFIRRRRRVVKIIAAPSSRADFVVDGSRASSRSLESFDHAKSKRDRHRNRTIGEQAMPLSPPHVVSCASFRAESTDSSLHHCHSASTDVQDESYDTLPSVHHVLSTADLRPYTDRTSPYHCDCSPLIGQQPTPVTINNHARCLRHAHRHHHHHHLRYPSVATDIGHLH